MYWLRLGVLLLHHNVMLVALHEHRSLKINNWQDGCPGSEVILADREQVLNCSTGCDGSVVLDEDFSQESTLSRLRRHILILMSFRPPGWQWVKALYKWDTSSAISMSDWLLQTHSQQTGTGNRCMFLWFTNVFLSLRQQLAPKAFCLQAVLMSVIIALKFVNTISD